MRKIAVFGSLKQGFYNHVRMEMGEPLGHAKIRGEMHLRYSYPHLYRPEVADPDLVREHDVEIYEIEDGVYEAIRAMELGAGYQEYQTTLTDDSQVEHEVVIFYTRDDNQMYRSNFLEEYSKETVPNAYTGDKLNV